MNTESILDPRFHSGLIANQVSVCRKAGIEPEFLLENSSEICQEAELAWVEKSMLDSATSGLVISGPQLNIVNRMKALTAIYLHNHFDAQLVSLARIVESESSREFASPEVLLIPDLS